MKHSICRYCLINFERATGFNSKFCSKECKEKVRIKKCLPVCDLSNLEKHRVKFKNGTEHTKEICKICRNGVYVKSNPEIRKLTNYQRKDGEKFKVDFRWLNLRYEVLKKSNRKCSLCGSTSKLNVDHIKPKSLYPELTYDINNLQVLCWQCNVGKSNLDDTDFRK